jgi:hypothetical protein
MPTCPGAAAAAGFAREKASAARQNPNPIIVRTWTATDHSGNAISCSQIINVTDTTPPALVCPPALLVKTTNPAGTNVPRLRLVIVKALVLHAAHNLSNDHAEYQLRDRYSFGRFPSLGIEDRQKPLAHARQREQ